MRQLKTCGISGYVRYMIATEENEVVLCDYIASSGQIAKGIGANIMRSMPLEIGYRSFKTRGGCFSIRYNYMKTTSYSGCPEVIVANTSLQDNLGKGETKQRKGLLLATKEDMGDKFYHALMYGYDMPLKKEWSAAILNYLDKNKHITISTPDNHIVGIEECDGVSDSVVIPGVGDVRDIYVIDYRDLTEDTLEECVSYLLRNKEISMTEKPQKKLEVKTLDDYMALHGKDIVSNLRSKASPRVEVDGTWKWSVNKTRRLFASQADCVTGMVEVLKDSSYCIVNEGMGCGKTLQSMDAVEGYMVRKYMNTHHVSMEDVYRHPEWINYRVIVMCPGHLVKKWKEEIESQIPDSKAIILDEFRQLLGIRSEGRKAVGRRFYIIGKDFGKLSYMSKPIPTHVKKKEVRKAVCAECGTDKSGCGNTRCVCGSNSYKLIRPPRIIMSTGLTCPECGELLLPAGKESHNWDNAEECRVLTPADFSSQTKNNDKCWYCGTKLWEPLVQNLGGTAQEDKWYKVKRFTNATHKSTDTIWVLKGYEEDYILNKGGAGCMSVSEFMPTKVLKNRKYSPLQFIKKYLKGYFDFALLDEVHKYKGGGSSQGIGAGWLIASAKKTLALTGTLSGGKAEDLFYLLYRLDPGRMMENGFSYGDVQAFSNTYGCVEEEFESFGNMDEDEMSYNSSSRGRKTRADRVKPGISPLVFTKFLLDKTVFLDLKDMSNQLPPLNEYVVGVDLEKDITEEYNRVLDDLKAAMRNGEAKLMSARLQFALSFADKPYGRTPILSPMDGRVVATPADLEKYKTELTNKEKKLVEIVQKEISEGRNIFVYAEYTRSPETNVTPRLVKILEREIPELKGKVAVLESGTPDTVHRMDWIKEKAAEGKRVIITNPELCECGLDFIFDYRGKTYNYPTIIQYQMGYDLCVLWQSVSRHFRLIQTEECRTYYLYSRGTIQLAVLELMAQKKNAVSVLQGGGFSSEGLSSMAQGVNAELALAKALQDGVGDIEEAVASMYQRKEDDGSEQYERDFMSHPLYHELLGIEESAEESAGDEYQNADIFELFGCLMSDGEIGKESTVESIVVPEIVESKLPETEAGVNEKPEESLKPVFDLFNMFEVTVAEKSKNRKSVSGQIMLF